MIITQTTIEAYRDARGEQTTIKFLRSEYTAPIHGMIVHFILENDSRFFSLNLTFIKVSIRALSTLSISKQVSIMKY